ncbi:hypothetical protein BO70DRAFT_394209 [Aspergillus heteromorphus CBS 117.55]|uniref:Uncharacterized protein n=1 Tax=Aspergillus heteromorphus CBS 117.55 TaxID=1448321 RepID=A0A317WUH8_9EURO|nr:uncharacterized protein BO70DRAFT_394209 [Aspergillus heteromorphus CBS 117.55]PWY88508.1 hypothetical protein BO70DRAFT_394209 [Aspergillus heteromorphus CBS 117.55]
MFKSLAAIALGASLVGAQSPPGYIPSSNNYLGVDFQLCHRQPRPLGQRVAASTRK